MVEGDEDPIAETISSIASSLLERARQHDEDSWRLLVGFHAPMVYGWCRMRGLNAEASRDVGQEVFASVAKSLHKFDRNVPGGTLRGWIRSITENKIKDHWRETALEPYSTGGSEAMGMLQDFPMPEDSDTDEDKCEIEKGFLSSVLNYAKEHIRPDHWQVFWQLAVEGRSPAEVAESNGLDRAHVYVIKSRVLGQLRKIFLESNETKL